MFVFKLSDRSDMTCLVINIMQHINYSKDIFFFLYTSV